MGKLPYTRVELALEELRLLFLAPQQGQLPLRIVHELIGSLLRDEGSAYRLPCERSPEFPCWLGSLPPLRAAFDAMYLTSEEREYAELLADPDMLNQDTIAEILELSGNRAGVLRALLRSRLGVKRRNEVRVRLLHAALDHTLRSVHPPSVGPTAPPRRLVGTGQGGDDRGNDVSGSSQRRDATQSFPRNHP